MADLNKIIDELSKLTVVEAAELSKQLEEKWGVKAAAPVAAAPAVQSVPDYTHLTPGGQDVTGQAGETVYLSPDGTAWTMQADSSFIRTS